MTFENMDQKLEKQLLRETLSKESAIFIMVDNSKSDPLLITNIQIILLIMKCSKTCGHPQQESTLVEQTDKDGAIPLCNRSHSSSHVYSHDFCLGFHRISLSKPIGFVFKFIKTIKYNSRINKRTIS